MAFKCAICLEYKGSKQRYQDGFVCKDCHKKYKGHYEKGAQMI